MLNVTPFNTKINKINYAHRIKQIQHLVTPLLFIVKYLTIAYSYTKVKTISNYLTPNACILSDRFVSAGAN